MQLTKVEFTDEELSNLQIFLGRVDLKGNEVIPFYNIMLAIEQAKQKEVKGSD